MDRQQLTIKLIPEKRVGTALSSRNSPDVLRKEKFFAIDMAKEAIILYIESMKQDD